MKRSKPRRDPSDGINLDVLTKTLKRVDKAEYDHNLMAKTIYYLSRLPPKKQELVIRHATGVRADLMQLLEHIRGQFVLLRQVDDEGTYCGLGFGRKCTSVGTWSSWKNPKSPEQMDVTDVCYRGTDGQLRCGQQLEFIELWMDLNQATFQDFLEGVPIEQHDF